MMELLAVLVIVAILSISVSGMIGRAAFDTAAFADQVRAQLAYAQKVAIATRRTVTVTIGGNTVSLAMCVDAACASTTPVPSPQGDATFTRTAPAGVTIAPDTSFAFNPLGDTSLASSLALSVTGDMTRVITVEATTGHVHH